MAERDDFQYQKIIRRSFKRNLETAPLYLQIMWQNGKISAKMINATLSCADANAGWWHLISTFGIKMPSNIKEAIDRIGFFGAHTVILGWYENEDIVRRELEEITTAMNNGDAVYRLQYYTDIKISAFGTASRK